MDIVLEKESYIRFFREFVKEGKCEENLAFWLAVQKFKQTHGGTDVAQSFKRIYDKYIREGAEMMTSLPHNEMTITERELKSPNLNSFDAAEKVVYKNLRDDSYKRFLMSPQYSAMIKEYDFFKRET